MKQIVILRGPLNISAGYQRHAMDVFRFLLSKPNLDVKTQLTPWGSCPMILDSNAQNGLIGEAMSRSIAGNLSARADFSLQCILPNEWTIDPAHFNIGITAGVETDICNPQWIDHLNKMNLIIVPSNHTKQTFERTAEKYHKLITTQIKVVPESFPNELLNPEIKPLDLNLKTSFNYLSVAQITGNNPQNDRKNLFFTIKWFCEVFKNDPDVGLIIKTNTGRNSVKDRMNTEAILKKLTQEIGKKEFPRIYLLHGYMTDAEMAGLYNHPSVKCFISLTRGEGFGLPILEASASGLPIIATNYSGHLDFMNKGKFIKVNYELSPIHESLLSNKNIFSSKEARWANPIEEDAKMKMEKFRHRSTLPQEWAKELKQIIQKEYHINNIIKLYDEAFVGILN